MSARSLFVLALVALVTVQANSYPFNTKGGQSYYQEPLKGGFAQSAAPAQVELPAAPAPVLSQSYEAPLKGSSQSFYSEPIKGYAPQPLRQSTVVASEYRPVQQFAQTSQVVEHAAPVQMPAYQAPVYQAPSYQAPAFQAPAFQAPAKGVQSYGQSYHQEPLRTQFFQAPMRQPVMESYKSPAPLVQPAPQQVELAVTPAPVLSYEAPIKGGASQSFYSEPIKGQFQQPLRQPVVESFSRPVQQVQSTHVVESAPVQSYEAPVKGYYQEPLKGQFGAAQQLRH